MIYVLSTAITELSKAMIHLAKLVQDLLNCTVGCGSVGVPRGSLCQWRGSRAVCKLFR